jgi:hypothetical protein
MREQLARQARRVPAALAVVLCAALLLIPAASRASGHETAGTQTAQQIHSTDTAVVLHATRTTVVKDVPPAAGVVPDSGTYPSLQAAQPAVHDQLTPAATSTTETFHERAPPR